MNHFQMSFVGTNPGPRHFIFATGIENSYPVITGKDGKNLRRDGMQMSGHYDHWREDFALIYEMGIRFVRCGPPLYRCHLGVGKYDWSFPDKVFPELKRLEIIPITDLCHFGVPDWIGDFQNPEWPHHFAAYAGEFARRYPWIRLYTPVNEIFIAASFSAQLGWWNERKSSDKAFVTALKHLVRANLLAEQAILEVQPDALFVQSESSEYFHQAGPETYDKANFYNQKRFLSLDLSYGHDVLALLYEYLLDNGMKAEEYHWFLEHGGRMRPYCIMGNDYYDTNEHKVTDVGGAFQNAGEIFGYYVITHQYFDRYRLPVMHTETNLKAADDAPRWLWKEWSNILRLRQDGVPILGFTWYSLIDQTDWDVALREDNGKVNECGLYDHDRHIHPVGKAYRELIAQWKDRLPMESMYRDIPTPNSKSEPAAPKRSHHHRAGRARHSSKVNGDRHGKRSKRKQHS